MSVDKIRRDLAAEIAEDYGRDMLDDWMGLAEILYDRGLPADEDEDIRQFRDLIKAELDKRW